MIRILILLFCAALPAVSQTQVNYIFNLDNGAQILYQVYSEVPIADGDKSLSNAEAAGNRIRRVLVNGDGKPWLGFEIHVERVPGGSQFRLSVEPIAGVPFFAHKAVPRYIENADRILLDVLEQPSTRKRVFDTFQVGTKGTPMQIMPLSRSIPQPAPPGSVIRLENPRLIEGTTTLATSQSTQAGNRVGIRTSKAGQFMFSTEPASGYRMEGIAEGNSLRFVTGHKRYDITCTGQIVNRPGSWYVWVKAVPSEGPDDTLQVFLP